MRNNCHWCKIALILFACLISGCKPSRGLFPKEINLEGRKIGLGDSLGMAFSVCSFKDYLVFRDMCDGTCFTLLHPDSSFCFHFGKRGDGPEEWIDPVQLCVRDSTLFVYDAGKKSMYAYSLALLLKREDSPLCLFHSDVDGTIISFLNMSDSIFIATGCFRSDKRFCVLDMKGEKIFQGEYDVDDEGNKFPFYVKGAAFQSMMTLVPHSNRFALSTRYGGVVELYEWNTGKDSVVKLKDCINLFVPNWSVTDIQGTPNFIPDTHTRWGYLFIDSDGGYIYALFSGLHQREGEPFISGNTIHVFDDSGTPVCEIVLDSRLRDFAVVRNKLYGLCEDSDSGYSIVEYTLPDKY